MANPVWPAALPYTLTARGYSTARNHNVIRSPVDVGVPKQRRRFLHSTDRRAFRLRIKGEHLAAWNTWIDTTLAGGALAFDWPNPEDTDTTESVRIVMPRGGLRRRPTRDGDGRRAWYFDIEVETV